MEAHLDREAGVAHVESTEGGIGNALDVLDTLKLGLIDGSLDQSTVARLKVAADGLTDTSGDKGLDGVLGEIDLRVAVELAKAGVR